MKKDLTPAEWHARFCQQARWTREVRSFLFSNLPAGDKVKILETGCGTGAVLQDLQAFHKASFFGLDINLDFLKIFSSQPGLHPSCGNVYNLPYASNGFQVTFCHYFLLWLDNPAAALEEIKRVTCSGGFVLALAEPYYAGRLDYPLELQQIGQLQRKALQTQGADPDLGIRLGELFAAAGLKNIHTGLTGGQWSTAQNTAEQDQEWKILMSDLQESLSDKEMDHLRKIDHKAWKNASRVLYVPTFYAWAQV